MGSIAQIMSSFGGSVATAYDTDAQAFITAVGTLTTPQEAAINDLVVGLKANGTWSKYKAIYPFIGGTASSHKWNLKDPRDLDAAFRLTFYNNPSHTSQGVDFKVGGSEYADSHLVPSIDLSLNDTHVSFYSHTPGDSTETDIGASNSGYTNCIILAYRSYGQPYVAVNSDYEGVTLISDVGYAIVSRLNSSNFNFYSGGTNQVVSKVSTGLSNNSIWVGGLSGSVENSYRISSFATIGSGLTLTEIANDYTVIQAYQIALGREV